MGIRGKISAFDMCTSKNNFSAEIAGGGLTKLAVWEIFNKFRKIWPLLDRPRNFLLPMYATIKTPQFSVYLLIYNCDTERGVRFPGIQLNLNSRTTYVLLLQLIFKFLVRILRFLQV